MQDEIIKAMNWRYAVQVFDPTKSITDEELHTILEAGRLSPSSFGTEPWKFIVVENKEVRSKIKAAGFGQPKITDADRLIIVAYRTDARENISQQRVHRVAKTHGRAVGELEGMKSMIDGSISERSDAELDGWVKSQAYIPLGVMIETAALLGIDSGPMEGFSADEVDAILGLREKHLHSTAMLALGHRGDDPAASRPKVRQDFDEVVEFVK